MRQSGIILMMFAALGCAPAGVLHRSTAADIPPLTIHIEDVDEFQRVTLEAINTSSGALSVTPAFGFDFYFHLEIEADDGTPMRLPAWELTREIGGRCFMRGETLSLRVPLRRWSPVQGTDADCTEEPCNRTKLLPGVYRVRGVYRPVQKGAVGGRCAPVPTVVASEWRRFNVPMSQR